ncbi:MAG TPA: response regulator [Polyangiales bacterium]
MMTQPHPQSDQQGHGHVVPARGRVLIADDETLVSRPLAKLLMNRGYSVTCVETGWAAGEAVATGAFDLLVTDIVMPGNTTLDVLRAPEVRTAGIPVIVITGHPTVDTAVGALRLSAVDYFVKPIQPEAFLAGVERAIGRGRALKTAGDLKHRMERASALLESVRSTLDPAGAPLLGANADVSANDDGEAIRTRLLGPEFAVLSPREREVLALIAQGARTYDAAESLGISICTVRNHLKSVYRKVGVSSQVALVRKVLA